MTWVRLAHYQGHEVNELGQIRNVETGQLLKTSVNQSGVRYVAIRNTTLGKYENRALGTLIAETFCERHAADQETVLHLDGDTENNAASNLMWATRWHAMAYHSEMAKQEWNPRIKVQDAEGRVYANIGDAAMATGCLPSAIDYAIRYNANLAASSHLNFVHRVYPGSHIFYAA